MVYHQPMYSQTLLFALRATSLSVLCVMLLVACATAPTGLREDRSASRDRSWSDEVEIQRRSATQVGERADQTISELMREQHSGRLSAERALSALLAYSINELQWQRQAHQSKPEISGWIELALLVQTHKLNAAERETALRQWERRWGSTLTNATTAREAAQNWVETWQTGWHGPKRVGVLLPAESALATPGDMIKTGLVDEWLTMPRSVRPELFFYYVNDNNLAGLYEVVNQAREDQVEWLIGPLPRNQVEHILRNRSARWMMPTLFLNVPSDEGLLRGLHATRLAFALNPETDAEEAAQLAHRLGLDRALVLSQDTTWGDRVADSFTKTFKSKARQIVDQASYDPNRVDHSDLLESVLGLNESKARIASIERLIGQPVVAEPQRRGDIDMIFLASRASDAKQIRPQLQFFRAEDLPVVTTAYAVDGALDPRRDVDLEGVYLPMAPWFINQSAAGSIRQSAQIRHPELMTPAWSHLYAMGRDLMGLIRWLGPMNQDPDLMLNGMTGQLTIATDKQVNRQLTAVQIVDGQSKVLD